MDGVALGRLGVHNDVGWLGADARLLISLGLIAAVLLGRWALVRRARRRAELLSDEQLRYNAIFRNVGTLALLLGLVALWLPELQRFALSITAFAVAIVIATKELIMCVAGGAVRSMTGAFHGGDWIEVGGHSGEVVDHNLVATVLQEVDPVRFEHTGRQITLPNSLFLLNPVTNHSFRKRYIFHEFVIHSEPAPDALAARAAIEAAVVDASADFAEVARRYCDMVQKRGGVKLPDPAPDVRLRTTDFAKLRFEVRLFCPRDRAGDVEQAAMRGFLGWVERQPWRFAGVAARDGAAAASAEAMSEGAGGREAGGRG